MTSTPVAPSDLLAPKDIRFEDMFVDPNNPRIAPESPPGYDDPARLFERTAQAALIDKVYEVYEADRLEAQIVDQGWVPVDPILVWKHPDDTRYVVIEGNTRTSVLTRVRGKLPKERTRLERLLKAKGSGPETPEIRKQKALIGKMEALTASTETIRVLPIKAATVVALNEVLPRLHGVRHVVPAKPWGPHAVGLYILSLYQEKFAVAHPGEDLCLDEDIIDEVASMLPRKPDEIREYIQAASAFAHFKLEYEDRAEAVGNSFQPSDQYFFGQILQNKVARDSFGFGRDDLNLGEKAEEALFQWAFSKKRDRRKKEDDDDVNVFQKAEDMRVWQRVYNYDKKTGVTHFHTQLDIDAPLDAPPIRELAAKMTMHKQVNTPLRTLEDLLASLRDLKADTLADKSAHVRGLLKELEKQTRKYLALLDRADPEDDGD